MLRTRITEDGPVTSLIRNYRVLSLLGRVGSGKTLLAFYLAYRLVRLGYFRHIVSNIPCVWNTPLDRVDLRMDARGHASLDTVVVLDEGGLFLKTSRDTDKYLAFLRKFNVCILVPSVEPPASKLTKLSFQRVFNAGIIGIPAWQYMYSLRYGQIKQQEHFWFINPPGMYGVYDTGAVPSSDEGISDWLLEFNEREQSTRGYTATFARKVGRTATINAGGSVGEAGGDTATQAILEAVGQMETALSVHAADFDDSVTVLSKRRNKFGRRR